MLPAYLRLRSLRVLHSRSGTVQFFKREGRTMLDGIFPHRFPFVMQPAYLHFYWLPRGSVCRRVWILPFRRRIIGASGGLFGIPWFSIS